MRIVNKGILDSNGASKFSIKELDMKEKVVHISLIKALGYRLQLLHGGNYLSKSETFQVHYHDGSHE